MSTAYTSEGDAYTVSIPLNQELVERFSGDSLGEMLEAAAPQPSYIGNKKVYSNEDPSHRKPREGYTTDVYVLNLSKPDDLEKYKEILNQAGTSLFTKIRYIERHWDESSHNWIILIELTTKVLVDPDTR